MSGSQVTDNSLETSGVLVNNETVTEKTPAVGTKPEETPAEKPDEETPEETEETTAGKPPASLRSSHILALALRRALKGPAPTLDHIIRFLSSSSGHDKAWMLTQYFTKVLAWIAANKGHMSTANRIRAFSGLVSDYRIMIRLTGLIPMAQYVRYGEQVPAQTKLLQWLDRIMNLALIIYYPLEHTYWLGAHKLVPISDKVIEDAGYWSCRFWAIWVALQFVHLGEEYRLIKNRRAKIFTQGKRNAHEMQEELDAVESDTKSWKIQLLINACYFPLTLHWSIRGSTFPDVAVGVCGTVAAAAQAYNVWNACA